MRVVRSATPRAGVPVDVIGRASEPARVALDQRLEHPRRRPPCGDDGREDDDEDLVVTRPNLTWPASGRWASRRSAKSIRSCNSEISPEGSTSASSSGSGVGWPPWFRIRSARALPTGLKDRRKSVPPPKMNVIASTPSISIPRVPVRWWPAPTVRDGHAQCFREQRAHQAPGGHTSSTASIAPSETAISVSSFPSGRR